MQGFHNGCRPIIGLDGCHLKGVYGGQLLSAVGRDGNDNLFPISMAVVEAETKDSWTWFLMELTEDIKAQEKMKSSWISDRHKGLTKKFQQIMSTADHIEHGLIILSFDVDDERFRNIMLPQDYLNGHNEVVTSSIERLAVIKGSLALIVFSNYFDAITTKCHIWVMREYGVVESWTKTSVPVHSVKNFYGYTVNGKLLIENANRLVSFDPKSLNENVLAIEAADWMGHTDTANSMEEDSGCRPIIGLDECHLKGVYGGQLLSAVGRAGADRGIPTDHANFKIEFKRKELKYAMSNETSCSTAIDCVAHGLAYHSQNNDFKILRIGQVNKLWAKAEVYTLSMDSWRELVMPVESLTRSRSIGTQESFCLFLNGALHTRVDCAEGRFILSFDVNDERFRKIMLPQNYLVGVSVIFEQLAVILGLLTLFLVTMWMKLLNFCSCTDNGELLIEKVTELVSLDLESLNENKLAIQDVQWMDYTPNSIESLVLLDGINVSSEYED
uniref:F-box associated domain-containing protein n=1 Tax=Fagus sylvatica TaxID=28930 RepID=A0A2N9GC12_FAGSY